MEKQKAVAKAKDDKDKEDKFKEYFVVDENGMPVFSMDLTAEQEDYLLEYARDKDRKEED
jgi:hypothetical protein